MKTLNLFKKIGVLLISSFLIPVLIVNGQESEKTKASNRLSVGLSGTQNYDVFRTSVPNGKGFDFGDFASMRGSMSGLDFGFGGDLTYFFSSIFSGDLFFGMGSITTGSDVDMLFSKTDFTQYGLGFNASIKPKKKESYKWVPYLRMSMSQTTFDNTVSFVKDGNAINSASPTTNDKCITLGAGLGLRYHINDKFHLFAQSEFVSSNTDIFDGNPSGNGTDGFFRSALGLRFNLMNKSAQIDRKSGNGGDEFSGGTASLKRNSPSTKNLVNSIITETKEVSINPIFNTVYNAQLQDEVFASIKRILHNNPGSKLNVSDFINGSSVRTSKRDEKVKKVVAELLKNGVDERQITYQTIETVSKVEGINLSVY